MQSLIFNFRTHNRKYLISQYFTIYSSTFWKFEGFLRNYIYVLYHIDFHRILLIEDLIFSAIYKVVLLKYGLIVWFLSKQEHPPNCSAF